MIKYHKPPFKLREIKIEVTNRCSLNCVHCSSDAHPGSRLEMSAGTCKRVLKEASQLGAVDVAFSGGEPLMWQGIVDAAEEATRLSYSVTIYSSGHVHDFPSIAARLREAGVKRFVFSLFGDTALCHERVTRIRGSFQKTIAGVTTCAKMGIETEIHFVPLASNCRSLCGIAVLARKAGAARISVLRFVPQGRGALLRSEALTRAQNLELKRTIEQLRSEGHAVRTGSPFNFLMVNDSPKCCSGIDRLIVTPDSRICPCDAFKQIHAEDLVGTADGSVLNGVSLGECWEKSPYLLAVRKYLTTPFAPDCQPCRLLEDCLSGCLAQKVLAYGGLDKRPDPDCIKN